MKKFFLLLFSFFPFICIYTQEKIPKELYGKWYVYTTQEKGEQPEQVDNKEDEWIDFQEKGKVVEGYFGEILNNEWVFSKEKATIKIFDKEEVTILKILELVKDRLVVEVFEGMENNEESLIVTYTK